MKQYIPAADLDFDKYKQSLKTFMKSQQRFSDYDFEGSNLSVLIDLLAYNAFNQAHYLNMVGSEMFLDSSQLRETIVSHAKELNYTPRSAISARCNVVFEIFPLGTPQTVTVPAYYAVRTNSNNNSDRISFVTDQPVVITRNQNGQYISNPITIFEGIAVKETFEVVPTNNDSQNVTYNQRFVLQSENIDITSIKVLVKRDSADLHPVVYTRATDLFGLSGESEIFFVRGFAANNYELEFGDGILGRALEAGNVVEVYYRDTIGAEGNGTFSFVKTSSIDGNGNIEISTVTRATGGAPRESNESIKYNAVRHFQTQNRAVIADDYESLIRANFPDVQQVNVYGGEEVFQYGKVMIVLKPYAVEGVVEQNTKNRVVEFLKTKNIVPEPIIVDPQYFYVEVTGNVKYDVDLVNAQENKILADINNALIGLNDTVFNDFDVDVHQSVINKAITDANPSILGSDISLKLTKRWFPQLGVNTTVQFQTDNPIVSSKQGAYTNPNVFAVTSSLFQMIVDDQVENVMIRDDGIGNLFVHVVRDANTLIKISPAVGTIDYTTGNISMSLDVYRYIGYIKFTCELDSKGINVSRDKFALIDSPDIHITLVK